MCPECGAPVGRGHTTCGAFAEAAEAAVLSMEEAIKNRVLEACKSSVNHGAVGGLRVLVEAGS